MNLAWLRESKEVKAPNITAFLIRYAKVRALQHYRH